MIDNDQVIVGVLKIFFVSCSILHLVLILNRIIVELNVSPNNFTQRMINEIKTEHLRVAQSLVQNFVWEMLAIRTNSVDNSQRDHQELKHFTSLNNMF